METSSYIVIILMALALSVTVFGIGSLVLRNKTNGQKSGQMSNRLMVLRIVLQASAIIIVAIVFYLKKLG